MSIGGPRCLVDEAFAEASFVPFSLFFKGAHTTHIRQFAESIDYRAKTVTLCDSDEEIHYDILVIATGRAYAKPFRFNGLREKTSNDRLEMTMSQDEFRPQVYSTAQLGEQIAAERKKLQAADAVVVVGGGATGIETAAEIRDAFPDKKVTLYHSKARLLSSQREVSDADAALVMRKLLAMDIDVRLSTHYEPFSAKSSNYVVQANGGRPLTEFVPKISKTDEGFVKCDSYLNVLGEKYVFAMGDIVFGADASYKTATASHAPVVAKNINRVLNGEPMLKRVGELSGALKNFFVLALGHNDSLRIGMVGKMFGGAKQKDYFQAKMRKELGCK